MNPRKTLNFGKVWKKKTRNSEKLGRNLENQDKISIKKSQPWVQNLKVAKTHEIIKKPRVWNFSQKIRQSVNLTIFLNSKVLLI